MRFEDGLAGEVRVVKQVFFCQILRYVCHDINSDVHAVSLPLIWQSYLAHLRVCNM